MNVWINALTDAQVSLQSLIANDKLIEQCTALGEAIVNCFKSGNKILICGNGGSHCDALHFAEEWTGRYRGNRKALPVIALGEASHSTCVSNDFGFEHVFSRQVEAFGKKGDLLITMSTSGNSANILKALESAQAAELETWGLLGKDGGKALSHTQKSIVVPGKTADRIQELHMLILHISIEHAERILFPENY
ncbi:MAG: SIS domain-containing protein [Bdellovibrionota bacterium]